VLQHDLATRTHGIKMSTGWATITINNHYVREVSAVQIVVHATKLYPLTIMSVSCTSRLTSQENIFNYEHN